VILPGVIASSGGVASSFESIATTLLSSSSATITFSSIPSTYSHLQIRFIAFNATDVPVLQFNGNTTAGNYVQHNLVGNGTSASASAYTASRTSIKTFTTGSNATSPYASVIDVLDYTSTNKNKTVRMLSGFDTNGGGEISLISGLFFPSTIASITSISIVAAAGTFATNSHFALYGVKG